MTMVEINNLSKLFYLRNNKRLSDIWIMFKNRKFTISRDSIWILKNINLTINKGDRIAVMGRNGCGKSTLLKILSRVTLPTEGTIKMHGTCVSLLEIGTGFHEELTGRQNIFLYASMLGMTRQETIKQFSDIVAFADIDAKFIDVPVKRYSSGMEARLAFSIIVNIDRDIIIIDEVIAVGDTFFQKKAFDKITELSERGKTLILVNHDHRKLMKFCNRAILIDKGNITKMGDPETVIEQYLKL